MRVWGSWTRLACALAVALGGMTVAGPAAADPPAMAVVEGRVTGPDGAPLVSVVIVVRQGAASFTGMTDEEGRYRIEFAAPAVVTVEAHPYYEFVPHLAEYFDDTYDPAAATPLNLTPGATATADFQLARAPIIEATVSGPTGAPLPGVCVSIDGNYESHHDDYCLSRTNAEGVFTQATTPGAHKVCFDPGDLMLGYASECFDDAPTPDAATPVVVGPDERAVVATQIGLSGAVPGAPAAPRVLSAHDGRVVLSWTAPRPGATPITDYVIQTRTSGSTRWESYYDGVSATPGATIEPLRMRETFYFRVAAKNAFHTGAPSASTGAVTVLPSGPSAPTVPAAPQLKPDATAGDGSVALSWWAPDSGGAPITDYVVEVHEDGAVWVFDDGLSTSTTATVTGLVNGQTYNFSVAARNAVGVGERGPLSFAVTPRAGPLSGGTVPGAPSAPTVLRARDGQVVLRWSPPRAGSAPITDYVVQYRESLTTNWLTYSDGLSATTEATVTGLGNLRTYYFRLGASNAVGTSGSGPSTGAVTVRPS